MGGLDYSVVLEWDNVHTSGVPRAREALRRIVDDMRREPRRGELLVVYAEDVCDAAALRAALEPPAGDVTLRLVSTRDGRYYQLKDAGVRAAAGRSVAMLDSDLLIEPGCLRRLLSAVDEPGAGLVAGNTYLDHDTLYQRTFALAWGFPLRADDAEARREVGLFYANNAAAARELWLRFPFGSERVRYRELCVDVSRRLRRAGVPIWLEPSARASHPAPEFWSRAPVEGADRVFRLRATRGRARTFLRLWSWLVGRLGESFTRLLRQRHRVGLSAAALPAAWGLAAAYYGLAWAGGVVTLLRPARVERSLREQRAAGAVHPLGPAPAARSGPHTPPARARAGR